MVDLYSKLDENMPSLDDRDSMLEGNVELDAEKQSMMEMGDMSKENDFKEHASKDQTEMRQRLDQGKLTFPLTEEMRRYLEDPVSWVNNFPVREFLIDHNYLQYVEGLLDFLLTNPPCHSHSPVLMLRRLITPKVLSERINPMRTALRLQYLLKTYALKENNGNSIYDRQLEELELIPSKYASDLMAACITPVEVAALMHTEDDTMYRDVLQSRNKCLVASKFYQKIVWRKFWGSSGINETDHSSSKIVSIVGKFVSFMIWNFLYIPLTLLELVFRKMPYSESRQRFLSPLSSYLANLMNNTILIVILMVTSIVSVPDTTVTRVLVEQFLNGSASVEEPLREAAWGKVVVRLPLMHIPYVEWLLWTCIFSRVLSESFQVSQQKHKSCRAKLKMYLKGVSNVTDLVLLLILTSAMALKLHCYVRLMLTGIYRPAQRDSMFVSREQITAIYLYCVAAVVSLVHFLHLSTIHVPWLGPLIRGIKCMFKEISRAIFMFAFFIVGFLVPMVVMVACYRTVYNIDGVGDENDFYSFSSFSNTALTLTWSMFGGLANNHKTNLYQSRDKETTVFLSFMLILYAILLGLMCMNLLIAMMCNAYSEVTAHKAADWRFAQFQSIQEYTEMTNKGHGMPFLFPLCIPYLIYMIATSLCCNSPQPDTICYDSNFARLLCKRTKTCSKEVSDSKKAE